MTAPALGTLTWWPATDRLDLLAAPVAAAVATSGASLFVAEIDPSLADTAAFCAAYEVGLDASANCVVVAGRRGETTTTAACLVLARDRADVNKTVASTWTSARSRSPRWTTPCRRQGWSTAASPRSGCRRTGRS